MNNKLPNSVPLPEVSKYTEDVVFGELMFPVGFDQEQLSVNLRAIDRIRRAALIGSVSIVGVKGDISSYDCGITGINGSGVGSLVGNVKKHKESLSESSVIFPSQVTILDRPSVMIKVNSNETEERIREQVTTFEKGSIDPFARAKFLNEALRIGFRNASIDANVDCRKLVLATMFYGFFGSIAAISGYGVDTSELVVASMGPIIYNSHLVQHNYENKVLNDSSENLRETFARARQSLFYGAAIDRALVGCVLAMSTRFVKVM